MGQLTYEKTEMVRIEIDQSNQIHVEYFEFLMKENIITYRGGRSGGNLIIHYFSPHEAQRVIDWLENRGAKNNGT